MPKKLRLRNAEQEIAALRGQKATTRSDIQLKGALDDYGRFIEQKISVIEGLIVNNDPESMRRLEDIMKEIQNATTERTGSLYSMANDLKNALIRGRALERTTGG